MKKVILCHSGACCPAVEIHENEVVIGEDENIVRLKPVEWQILKEKVLNGEL